MKTVPDFEDTVTKLTALAESLRGIQELGVAQSTPIVETILRTRSRDVRHIEQTLDRLLDIACHPDGLQLFRSLCRHYWDIDPAAAAEYVLIYHKMWEQVFREVSCVSWFLPEKVICRTIIFR